MEERGNKTIMCSVLFLDIVEYSKKPVSGQISLKDRLNGYLSEAIREIPKSDRIILDTGDGAAINFLGDVEDALKTAINLRESLLSEGVDATPPLLVRMGINLGPVRLVRDINGQPNIVGDGINVAQRVMGFADIAQILVSRSYYDAVSRLSPQYAGMFHYQGYRTDKHVREHEVYAIGYPGERRMPPGTAQRGAGDVLGGSKERADTGVATRPSILAGLGAGFRRASPRQRAIYFGVIAVPLVLMVALAVSMMRHDKRPVAPGNMAGEAEEAPSSSVAPAKSPQASATQRSKSRKTAGSEKSEHKPVRAQVHEKAEAKSKAKAKGTAESKAGGGPARKAAAPAAGDSAGTFLSVNCKGAELFVDGTRKGRIGSSPLTVAVSPGKHAVIVSHVKGISSQEVVFAAGKTMRLNPDFCNQ